MSDILYKEACPKCQEEGKDTSADNLHVFSSGVKYCIARHGTMHKLMGTNNMTEKKKTPSKFREGIYADIRSRGLTRKTCEFAGYMVDPKTKDHISNYHDAAGNLVMQQVRTPDKKFPILGDSAYSDMLWGMNQHTPSDKVFVTITEGQIDRLSVLEAFDCKYPVVSLPNGAKAAAKVITKHQKWLEGFKYVVLAFDNDKDGIDATKDCIHLLEPGKVRVAKFPQKDANDLLMLGDKAGIREAIYNAVEYIPDPILTGQGLLNSLDGYSSRTKPWPWKNANTTVQPIKMPAVYTIAAKPGVGKTEFIAELMRAEIGNGGKVGVIALEQTIQQVLIKLTDTLLGTKLQEVVNRAYTDEEKEMCRMVSENLVIYDHTTYGSSLETVVKTIPYMVKSLGCELIMFDNLSYSATSIAGDERKGIDKAMIAMKDSTVKYDYTLINVCHIKRDDSYHVEDEDAPLSIEMIRGSQGVEMFSDYIIGLHRDTKSDNSLTRNTLKAYVLKDRFTGSDTGKHWQMKFDQKTRRLT